MAGFEYDDMATAVKNVLNGANTSGASPYLSEGLSTTISTIEVSDPERVGIRWGDLPAVYIRIAESSEEAGAMGRTGPQAGRVKKRKSVLFEIFGLYRKEGAHTRERSLLTQVYNLAENIESIFQSEPKLSDTALWSHAERTDFGDAIIDGDVVKGVRIDLRAEYLFK